MVTDFLRLGPISVNFLRLSLVAGVFAAAVSSFVHEGTAQGLQNDVLIISEADWSEGYMGLGGGLVKAMAKRPRSKTVATPPAHRRRQSVAATRRAPRVVPNRLPIALVAQTLDRTGYNISNLPIETPAQ